MASELTIASATTRGSSFAGARESFATNSLLANLRAVHNGTESPALQLTRYSRNRGLE
jgi:hypothetical protein